MAKAIRILVYEGEEAWLKKTLAKFTRVGKPIGSLPGLQIREIFRRTYDTGGEPKSVHATPVKVLKNPNKVKIEIKEVEGDD